MPTPLRHPSLLLLVGLVACGGGGSGAEEAGAAAPTIGGERIVVQSEDAAPSRPALTNNSGSTSTSANHWCFEVQLASGVHNSECVPDRALCEQDLQSMRGYAEGTFRGCFPLATAFCYGTTPGRRLCFNTMADCQASMRIIPSRVGGTCQPSE
jgi:hypothetical protein